MMEWTAPYPWIAYAGMAVAILISLTVARRAAASRQTARWFILLPRLIVLCGLLLIMLNPVRRSETQLPPRASSVVCLFDVSRSMALDTPLSRLDQAKTAVSTATRRIPPDSLPRLQFYQFGESFSAVPTLQQLQATQDASDLRSALESLPGRFQEEAPRAVVVFSDGTVDSTDALAEVTAVFKRMSIPLHVMPVGDSSLRGDVAIQNLIVPRTPDDGEQVAVRVTLRSHGFRDERAVVQIRPAQASTEDAAPLAELPVTLSDDTQTFDLVVEADRDLGELIVEVPPLAGESIVANNRVPFRLVTRDRRIRVLYMEGTAGNEYRFIESALTEDPDIECLSMVVNAQYSSRPRLQRVGDGYRGFPGTRDELFDFDVVICSDISQGAFTREQLDWTADLVRLRGGGFAMVGGHTSFGAGLWDQTVWDQLIPVDMTGGELGRGYLTQTFQVVVPVEADSHPIWKLLDDPVANRRALDAMPHFYGANFIQRLKPAATVLGVSAQPLPQAGIMPVFASESYGRGRTFAMASDSTEYWGREFEHHWGEGDNRYFRRFWRNVVRWLSENSIAGNKRLIVETDRLIYRPGDDIQIAATTWDEEYRPTQDYRITATLLTDTDSSDRSALTEPSADTASAENSDGAADAQSGAGIRVLSPEPTGERSIGTLTARLPAATAGLQEFSTLHTARLRVSAEDGQGETVGESEIELQILLDSPELQRPQATPSVLAAIAQQTGGRVLEHGDDLATVLSQYPSTPGELIVHRTPLWDHPGFWLLLLALLSIEWMLRRIAGFG